MLRGLRKFLLLILVFMPILVTFSCGSDGGGGDTSISGRVTDSEGNGIQGVRVSGSVYVPSSIPSSGCSANPGSWQEVASDETDKNGNYSLFSTEEGSEGNINSGEIKVWPELANWAFRPSSIYVQIARGEQVYNVNFTGERNNKISGRIYNPFPLSENVTLTLDGPVTRTSSFNIVYPSSSFSFEYVPNGIYTLTPASESYDFIPVSTSFRVLNADVIDKDFTTHCKGNHLISGYVYRDMEGGEPVYRAILKVSGEGVDMQLYTRTDGYYGLCVDNGVYTIYPSYSGHYFLPESLTITVNGTDMPGQNFVARAKHAISGNISLPDGTALSGIIMNITGPEGTYTLYSNDLGEYAVSGLKDAIYRIEPYTSCPTYDFTPASIIANMEGTDIAGQDFSAAYSDSNTYSISGTITDFDGTGVEQIDVLAASPIMNGSGTTDIFGQYLISGLRNNSYTITPYSDEYILVPENVTEEVCNADLQSIDFNATTTWGRIITSDYRSLTSDDGSILSRYSSLKRIDSKGEELWSKYMRVEGRIYGIPLYLESVRETSDGNIIATGWWRELNTNKKTLWVALFNSNGNILWETSFDRDSIDYGFIARETLNGGYIVAGTSNSLGGDGADIWVIKLDANGGVLWQTSYGGADNENVNDLELTNDGGFVLAGSTDTGDSTDAFVIRLDSSGNIIWQKSYGGEWVDIASGIASTPGGGYIASGYSHSFNEPHSTYDAWVWEMDSEGTLIWQKYYSTTSYYKADDIIPTSDGGYALAATEEGRNKHIIVKTDSQGNIIWQKKLYSIYDSADADIAELSNGDFMIYSTIFVLRIHSDGTMDACNKLSGADFTASVSNATTATLIWNATTTDAVTNKGTSFSKDVDSSVSQICPAP